MPLRVYTNDVDWVVAQSEQDAWDVWEKTIGCSRTDFDDEFAPEPDDKVLTVWNDDRPTDISCDCLDKINRQQAKIDQELLMIKRLPLGASSLPMGVATLRVSKPLGTHPNGHLRGCDKGHEKMTCAEWALKNGRGFLGSTEF